MEKKPFQIALGNDKIKYISVLPIITNKFMGGGSICQNSLKSTKITSKIQISEVSDL